MSDFNEIKDRVITLERTFNAPRKLVWEAWTQAEHIAKWWGPQGMNTEVKELDFRTGGKWSYVMLNPKGGAFPTGGTFTEIVEYEKLVTTADFANVTNDVVMTILFEDLGEATKMTMHVTHKTAEYRDAQFKMGADKGWGSTFDRLAQHLENSLA